LPILARILKDRGIVTERQLQEAIQHQVLYGGRLGTSLYELGFITEDRLQEALARAHGVPGISVDLREVQPEAVAALPKALAARYKVFPYRLRGKTLTLLMVDPNDHATVARIGYSQGFIIRTAVIPEFRMIQLLRDYYGVDERWRFTDTHRPAATTRREAPTGTTAAARLDEAATRDEVVEALLAVCQRFFRRVLFFIVKEPWVLGWSGAGEGVDRPLVTSLRVPLDQPSIFRTVTRDRSVFIGRLGPEEENQRFLKALGKRPQSSAVLLPVSLRSRVVNLVYGDNGASDRVRGDLGELMVLLQKVPRAYLRIIRKRVADARALSAEEPETVERND
jgi:MshEN domain